MISLFFWFLVLQVALWGACRELNGIGWVKPRQWKKLAKDETTMYLIKSGLALVITGVLVGSGVIITKLFALSLSDDLMAHNVFTSVYGFNTAYLAIILCWAMVTWQIALKGKPAILDRRIWFGIAMIAGFWGLVVPGALSIVLTPIYGMYWPSGIIGISLLVAAVRFGLPWISQLADRTWFKEPDTVEA